MSELPIGEVEAPLPVNTAYAKEVMIKMLGEPLYLKTVSGPTNFVNPKISKYLIVLAHSCGVDPGCDADTLQKIKHDLSLTEK